MPSAPIVLVGEEIVGSLRALMESGVPSRPVPVGRICPICRQDELAAWSHFMADDRLGVKSPLRRFKVIARCNGCERRFETGRTYQLGA